MAHLFWLSDEAWAAIEPYLPHGQPGKPRVDDRRVISGILHVLKTGCRWRDVPAVHGPPTTIYNRFTRWSSRGVWQRMFERMAAAGPVPEELLGQHPHKGAPLRPVGKRGAWTEAVGISAGGPTSKVHALAVHQGRPVAFALTPGNVSDIPMAIPLLEGLPRPKRLIADKAYDAMSLRRWLKRRRIRAVIPSLATRTFPFPLDRKAYRRRNLIERMWGRLKNWRRIATRYDRLARNHLAGLALVSTVIAWT